MLITLIYLRAYLRVLMFGISADWPKNTKFCARNTSFCITDCQAFTILSI